MGCDQQSSGNATLEFYLALQKGRNQISGQPGVQQTRPVKQGRVGVEKRPNEIEVGKRHRKCCAESASAGKG